MRYARFIVAISLFWLANAVFACGSFVYSPSEYYLFHLVDLPDGSDGVFNPNSRENCLLWQQQSSSTIPLDDIYQVVYKYKLETLEALKSGKFPPEARANKMARWLGCRDGKEALNFLILAKNCEWLRSEFISPWYYPSKKDPVKYSLNEVAEMARQKANHYEFGDRYALQAVRAMTTLMQYSDIISFWNSIEKDIPEGFLRWMILSYVAGAYVHLDDVEEAKRCYKEANDLVGLLACDLRYQPGMSRVEEMELLYESYPDCPKFRKDLWEVLGRIEPNRDWEDDEQWAWRGDDREEIVQLAALCDKVLDGDQPADKAMWAYAATYIAHLRGDDKQADRYLKLAESTVKDRNLADAIKVMRIFIDAQICKYDKAYEQKLFGQLRWMQGMIEDNLDEEIAKGFRFYQLADNYSYYYWNDAMRCVLLGTVCPRLVELGNTTLALQLANYASYTLVKEVNRVEIEFYLPEDIGKYGRQATFNLYQYRHSGLVNDYDYCSDFAEMANSFSANALIAYIDVALKPKTEFQRFLNNHSYIDSDFLNELMGTHCLREMRYADAELYLAKVAPDYFVRTNVYKGGYLSRDPFSVERCMWSHGVDAKLCFARKMNRLEQDMASTSDPNLKAMLMLDFGIGLRNSFDYCWALTQYRRGCTSYYRDDSWEEAELTQQALKRAEKTINKALNAFTDDEYAAQAQLRFSNYKTVEERYPETLAAEIVRGHCDKYIDYHAEKRE